MAATRRIRTRRWQPVRTCQSANPATSRNCSCARASRRGASARTGGGWANCWNASSASTWSSWTTAFNTRGSIAAWTSCWWMRWIPLAAAIRCRWAAYASPWRACRARISSSSRAASRAAWSRAQSISCGARILARRSSTRARSRRPGSPRPPVRAWPPMRCPTRAWPPSADWATRNISGARSRPSDSTRRFASNSRITTPTSHTSCAIWAASSATTASRRSSPPRRTWSTSAKTPVTCSHPSRSIGCGSACTWTAKTSFWTPYRSGCGERGSGAGGWQPPAGRLRRNRPFGAKDDGFFDLQIEKIGTLNAAFRVPIFSICRSKKPSSFAPNGRFRRSRPAGGCHPPAPDPRSPQPLRYGVQKLVFAVQVHADPQPIEREGCEQVTGVFAEVDQVLLGGEDRLDAVVAELAAHIAQLVWLVGVVILEFDANRRVESEGRERAPEIFRVAQSAEGGHARVGQRIGGHAFAGGRGNPDLRLRARVEDRRARIPAPQEMLGGLGYAAGLATRDDEDIRAGQARQRLAQAAHGQRIAAAEGIERIHQHDVQAAIEPRVLKAVVQDDHVDAEFAFQQLTH